MVSFCFVFAVFSYSPVFFFRFSRFEGCNSDGPAKKKTERTRSASFWVVFGIAETFFHGFVLCINEKYKREMRKIGL